MLERAGEEVGGEGRQGGGGGGGGGGKSLAELEGEDKPLAELKKGGGGGGKEGETGRPRC